MKGIKYVLGALAIVVSIWGVGLLSNDCWYLARVMKNSSQSLSVLYAVVGFIAGYVLKNDGAKDLYMPFAGSLGIFVSSLLAGGVDLDKEIGAGGTIFWLGVGVVFVISLMLVVGFIYFVILTDYRKSKEKLEAGQSTS